MAVEKDSKADPDGTLVRVVDETGTSIEDFTTTKWSVHTSTPGSTCPVWINSIVLSKTLPGAKLGARLAGLDTAGQSSCSESQNVMAIIADNDGNVTEVRNHRFALVRSLREGLIIDEMKVAGEVWLTETPIQTIIENTTNEAEKADLVKMAARCKL